MLRPWAGIFSIETNLEVPFCPCYLKLKMSNLNEASIQEIWNAEALVQLRHSFRVHNKILAFVKKSTSGTGSDQGIVMPPLVSAL